MAEILAISSTRAPTSGGHSSGQGPAGAGDSLAATCTGSPTGSRTGSALALSLLGPALLQPLAGTEYRSRKILHDTQGSQSQENAFAVATVPCPHVEQCALAPVCPGEHYSVYRDLYGLDEFAPVRVAELYAAAPRGLVPAIRATARDFG